MLKNNAEKPYLMTVGYISIDHVQIESNEIETHSFPIMPHMMRKTRRPGNKTNFSSEC